MRNITLQEELHANTRRTRITYRGSVDGHPVAIKCYLKPAFGLLHWLRARRRGARIRTAGGAVPPVIYSGWVRELRCFGFATAFLQDYRPLRKVLIQEKSYVRICQIIELLGVLIADLHNRGIEQPDGNLTNFLLGPEDQIAVIDEDDIKVYPRGMPPEVALANLANVGSRIGDPELRQKLLSSYLRCSNRPLSPDEFQHRVAHWQARFQSRRASRNISPERRFD